MTVVAGVMLDDGGYWIGSDSAMGYEDGYRRKLPRGKWWVYPRQGCVIGESGADLHLSRVRRKIEDLIRTWKGVGLIELMHVQDVVFETQEDVKGESGLDALDLELLYRGAEAGIYVIGGDGGVAGPYEFTAIGHGKTPCNPILEYALKPSRMRKRTKGTVERAVFEAFRITEAEADSVCRPFYSDVFYF